MGVEAARAVPPKLRRPEAGCATKSKLCCVLRSAALPPMTAASRGPACWHEKPTLGSEICPEGHLLNTAVSEDHCGFEPMPEIPRCARSPCMEAFLSSRFTWSKGSQDAGPWIIGESHPAIGFLSEHSNDGGRCPCTAGEEPQHSSLSKNCQPVSHLEKFVCDPI